MSGASVELKDVAVPAAAVGPLFADQAIVGPRIPPDQAILLYSPRQWESFVEEWAFYCLKKKYFKVLRTGGAGDKGIDVAGFADAKLLRGAWDNYQCKHYDRPLYPTDAWPEIGKVLWYSFNDDYVAPRKYYFVAPWGAGTTLSGYLSDPSKLKKHLIESWDKHCRDMITHKQAIALEGAFLGFVQAFDLSIFSAKTGLELIEEHKQSPTHVARFGGGLPSRPDPVNPPSEIEPKESTYVAQLLQAYEDHLERPISDRTALKATPYLDEHFGRQRVAFYHAESLRVFARDSVPVGTFESLQDEIHSGVIDTCNARHADGYECVCAVVKEARNLPLTTNPLISRSKVQDREGICHQLANENRLQWTKR